MRKAGGFTLVELVIVIIILGVLAAFAIPRFLNIATTARIASLNALSGVLWSTTVNARAMCKLEPACDYDSNTQVVTILGKPAWLNYGWLDAGDNLGTNQIDTWVIYDGFTATIPDLSQTVFTLNGAPDPATCSVAYRESFQQSPPLPRITVQTSGC